VILRILLEDLYETDREAFFDFRLVSKACRNESEYLLFRSVTIHDCTATEQSQSLKTVERLRNSNDSTGEYVRHLKIGPFMDEDRFECEISPFLEDILRGTDNLQALTWNMNCAPLPEMLDLFHKLHPSAHLHLILRNRTFPLSRSLLSSPQLYTLDTEIYPPMPEDTGDSPSELLLINGSLPPSLQVLRLSSRSPNVYAKRAEFRNQNDWESVRNSIHMFSLNFQSSNRFPALEELSLRNEFFLSEETCTHWARATCWDKLQRLEIHNGAPRYFFASLTNRATNLKHLKFYLNATTHNHTWTLYPLDTGLPVLASFVASTSLHTLDFGVHYLDNLIPTLRVITQSLQGKLKNLTISYSGDDLKEYAGPIDFSPGMLEWEPEHYFEVLELVPGLEYLDARIRGDTVVGCWMGDEDVEVKWGTARKKLGRRAKGQRGRKVKRVVW
jgi:hypothetical protein